jgi:hypothetical protein
MKFNLGSFLLGAITLCANSSSLQAQTIFNRCDYCDVYSAQQLAKSFAQGIPTEVVVANPSNALPPAWQFLVTRTYSPGCYVEGGQPLDKKATERTDTCITDQAIEVPLSYSNKQLAEGLRQAYVYTGGTLKTIVTISPEEAGLIGDGPISQLSGYSAVDLNNPQVRDRLTGTFSSWLPTLATIAVFRDNPLIRYVEEVVSTLGVAFLGADGTTVTFQIKFPDGSVAEIAYEPLNSSYGKITELRDSDGRMVMQADNLASFNGFQEVYNERDALTWLRNANFLNVQVTGGGASSGSTYYQFSCIQEGGTITCRELFPF